MKVIVTMTLPDAWTPERIPGWRIWIWPKLRYTGTNKRFHSTTVSTQAWNREMPPATCHPTHGVIDTPHPSPHQDCMCGYYSLKPEILAKPETWHRPLWDVPTIVYHGTIGLVESWGEVIEYEHGYRAERMRITALIDLPHRWVQEFGYWYVDADTTRTIWNTRDHEDYERRMKEAAKTYRLPIISIEDAYARR